MAIHSFRKNRDGNVANKVAFEDLFNEFQVYLLCECYCLLSKNLINDSENFQQNMEQLEFKVLSQLAWPSHWYCDCHDFVLISVFMPTNAL